MSLGLAAPLSLGVLAFSRLEALALSLVQRTNGALWYVPQSLSGVWQNSGQTGAPAVGAAVGYLPAIGSANPMLQATGTNRPTLRQTAGRNYYLEFDGVSDRMGCTTLNTGLNGTMIAVASINAAALASPISSGGGSIAVPGAGLAFNASNQARLQRSDAVATTATVGGTYTAGVPQVLEATWNSAGQAEVFLNGVSVATAGSGNLAASTTGIALGANSPAGGNILAGNVYLAFYAPIVLSEPQRKFIRDFGLSLTA